MVFLRRSFMPKEGLMSPQTAEVSTDEAVTSSKGKQVPAKTQQSQAPAPDKNKK